MKGKDIDTVLLSFPQYSRTYLRATYDALCVQPTDALQLQDTFKGLLEDIVKSAPTVEGEIPAHYLTNSFKVRSEQHSLEPIAKYLIALAGLLDSSRLLDASDPLKDSK